MPVTQFDRRALAAAYSATGARWQGGPARVYERLAQMLVERCPGGVAGRSVLDVGTGTGAASRAAQRAGARAVVAVDLALGMLRHEAAVRPPAAAADSIALPLRDRSVGAVVAAFSLNHLADPAAGFAEAARVLAPGGGLAASAYAADDRHPVRDAVEAACRARGWEPEAWYRDLRAGVLPLLGTVERAAAATDALPGARIEEVRVPFPHLGPADLVAWRLGMAQVAPFVAGLGPRERAELEADAVARLGPSVPPLVRSCIVVTWQRA